MPSPFEQQFAAQLTDLFAQFGQPAKYTDPSGNATVGLTVIVNRDGPMQTAIAGRATGEQQTGRIRVMQSALAKPVKGGRFAIDTIGDGTGQDEIWTVETTPRLANGQHYCVCTRSGANRLMARKDKD